MPEIKTALHAPELGPGAWIQGPELSLRFARGAVVLVDFWEATCVNCLRTLPYLKAWHERYSDKGLAVVGVHAPEYEFGRSREVVAEAVRAEGIPYRVLLDAEYETWQRFANKFWPAEYLVDARGYLRYEHAGEGAYGETEEWIQRLLREAGFAGELPPPLAPLRPEDAPGAVCQRPTPELQLGFHRGRNASPEGYRPGQEVEHRAGAERHPPLGMFLLRGRWRHEAEYLETAAPDAELELHCEAVDVNLVAEGPGETALSVPAADAPADLPLPVHERGADVVARDGSSVALWQRTQMVRLIAGESFARRRLRLRFARSGQRVYAFSFTGCVR